MVSLLWSSYEWENPSALLEYSKSVGLAFQIIDDILDVEGDPLKVGKRLNKDNSAGKATLYRCLEWILLKSIRHY